MNMELKGKHIRTPFIWCEVEGVRFVAIPDPHLRSAEELFEAAKDFSERLKQGLHSIDGSACLQFEGSDELFFMDDLPDDIARDGAGVFLRPIASTQC